ncbi:hypothetical protein Taro_043870 [Colocasia esculenta]|uniref:Protein DETOXIFICATION n=1 Tax=Colocasia esculenta TaxID=4460 RepID=A0A843WM68_COLES|nr:hypothetical protein [Colocasia esculenta]
MPPKLCRLQGATTTPPSPPPAPASLAGAWRPWPAGLEGVVVPELRKQLRITLPLAATNLAWFAKTTITTMFLGRLGELQLAGGMLGFTFANVTGISVLTGLCGAMDPICGQAYGAGNYRLLHKTLLMATLLLLAAAAPISLLWLNVDKFLVGVGQQEDISRLAKVYVIYLLPDLAATSFLCPLKAYLTSQGVTLPILFSSAAALALHVPITVLLSRAWGLAGVATAVWLSDLAMAIMLAAYVVVAETRTKAAEGGGWWELQRLGDWLQLLRLSGPCCLTTCLEWWCYEILVLLTGRLPDARRMVAAIAVVLNFDYLLFAVMLSLGTCASTRVSNELGAGKALVARRSAYVSLGVSLVAGCLGCSAMAGARGWWGPLYSHDARVVDTVRRMMLLMALVEVVNYPLTVCGGIVRGTARPWLGMYASLGGFYLVALPLGSALAFRVGLGLGGLLLGILVGVFTTAAVLLLLVSRIDWLAEACKAQVLVGESITAVEGGHEQAEETNA